MLDLLKRQHQYYLELERLSTQQRSLIQANQPEELLNVLSKRQKIISRIGILNSETAPYREDWDELKDSMPPELRTAIQFLLAKLKEMLNAIIEHDSQDTEVLEKSKQQVREQIHTNSRAQNLAVSYSGTKPANNSNSSGNNFQFTG